MQVILQNSQFFHQRFGGVTRYSVNLIEKMINNGVDIVDIGAASSRPFSKGSVVYLYE